MRAVGRWILIEQEKTKTESGILVSDGYGNVLNIGTVISCEEGDFSIGDKVYFNKRNAIELEKYLLITYDDVYVVIE